MRYSNAKTAGLCCIRNFKYPFCITSLAKEGVSSRLSATWRFPRSSKQYNCTKKVKKKWWDLNIKPLQDVSGGVALLIVK